jgi:cell division protein FtsB
VLRDALPHGSIRRRRSRRRAPLAILCCLLITGYFGQHAISGKHGLEARARLHERGKRISVEVKRLEDELQQLQRDVALLSSDPPNTDFVAEIAADLLGFIPTDGLLLTATPTVR